MPQDYSKEVRNDETAAILSEFTKHITTHVISTKAGIFIGETECGAHDEFAKERGTEIATGRAEKAMAVALGKIDQPEDTKLETAVVYSRENVRYKGLKLVSTITPEEAEAKWQKLCEAKNVHLAKVTDLFQGLDKSDIRRILQALPGR